ncbi:MAG: hypothetical protein WCA35_29605 [Kovacikia sp.]
MPENFHRCSESIQGTGPSQQPVPWHTFPEIVHRLHREGIYIHPDQLAEFLLRHGLPVDLDYVPNHLRQKAKVINDNYQGDMARAEARQDQPSLLPFE